MVLSDRPMLRIEQYTVAYPTLILVDVLIMQVTPPGVF